MRWLPLLAILAATRAPAVEPPLQRAAHDLVGVDQGVFAQAEDGRVLAAVAADRPVHPASVTKVATTLALLERLGPEHRFTTRLLGDGPVRAGALEGDLVVEASGDPFLVPENALLMLLALHARGLREVRGTLAVSGPLLFDWQPDPRGAALGRALAGDDAVAAWAAVQSAHPEAATWTPRDVALRVAGRAGGDAHGPPAVLLVHRSPPLLRIMKALNCYSNNVFHLLSERIGGPPAVEAMAREQVPPPLRAAITIDNAAGAGKTNRLSPHAAVALVVALDRALERRGLSLPDVLPVASVDPGTLRERLPGGLVAGKTGTYGDVGASALVGAVNTRRWGRVAFAVLNRGVPVPEAHRRQDAFVQALVAAAEATPWDYRPAGLPTFREAEVEVTPAP